MLVLFPAGVLIMIVLAATAVDSSVAFLARRELTEATAAAANDAAIMSLSPISFYEGGRLEIDAEALAGVATRRVVMVLDAGRHRDLEVSTVALPPSAPGCAWTVRVSATSSVDYVFAPALPGSDTGVRITVSSTARPVTSSERC